MPSPKSDSLYARNVISMQLNCFILFYTVLRICKDLISLLNILRIIS